MQKKFKTVCHALIVLAPIVAFSIFCGGPWGGMVVRWCAAYLVPIIGRWPAVVVVVTTYALSYIGILLFSVYVARRLEPTTRGKP